MHNHYMDYLHLIIRYAIIAAILVAIVMGIRMAPRIGGSTVAPPDYRDLTEIPRYATVGYDSTVTLSQYQVGDLVVINPTGGGTKTVAFAWVGALPGDRLQVQQQRLYVNDQLLDEIIDEKREGKGQLSPLPAELAEVEPITIPNHHLYVVSDGHRHDSVKHGLFPSTSILGRVTGVRRLD